MTRGDDSYPVVDSAALLRATVLDFCRFIDELPPEALQEKTWGPREVLAHLVFWQESFVAQAEACLGQQRFKLPAGRFDELNVRAIAGNRELSVDVLLRRLKTANEQLSGLAQSHDPECIILEIMKGATPRTLERLMWEEAGHIGTHLRILSEQAAYNPQRMVERLRKTVERFLSLIQACAGSDHEGWSKEMLAYLLLYHEAYVAQIEAKLAKKPFQLPSDTALMAEAGQVSRELATGDLLHRFQAADERLQEFVQTLDPQDIILTVKRGADLRTLDDFIARVEGRIRSHHQKLARELIGRKP